MYMDCRLFKLFMNVMAFERTTARQRITEGVAYCLKVVFYDLFKISLFFL